MSAFRSTSYSLSNENNRAVRCWKISIHVDSFSFDWPCTDVAHLRGHEQAAAGRRVGIARDANRAFIPPQAVPPVQGLDARGY